MLSRRLPPLVAVLLSSAVFFGCPAERPTDPCVACVAHQQCDGVCLEACADGFSWDGAACVEVRAASCADGASTGCTAAGRVCVDGATGGACGACLAGFDEVGGACVGRTCSVGPTGLVAACLMEHRLCVEQGGTAACAGCAFGFHEVGGACVPLVGCRDLDCARQQRTCVEATGTTDATCGSCLAGLVTVGGACARPATSTCDPAPATGSILLACTQASRTCATDGLGARCADCVAGTVEDEATSLCVARVTCAQLDCGAQHRDCSELPNGRCAGCLPGFTTDPSTGACRAVVTCATLGACAVGESCEAATATADAFCRPTCPAGDSWSGTRCVHCPVCAGPGNTGAIFPTTAAGERCVCETQPGFFFSLAGDVGTSACDADADGWVRESARSAMTSEDPAVKANARCDVRTFDRFILQNEGGQSLEVGVPSPLALYETDRNDDDGLLALANLAPYGAGGRRLRANELNRLTRFCSAQDFNHNGVSDVDEADTMPTPQGFPPALEAFNDFSYFAELTTSAWEPPVGTAAHGALRITEKPRPATAAGAVPLHFAAADVAQERCVVWHDARFQPPNPTTGMNFARFAPSPEPQDFARRMPPSTPSPWLGMTHHNQYRCLRLVDPGDPTLDPIAAPHKTTVAQLTTDAGVRLQPFTCAALAGAGDSVAPAAAPNPFDAKVTCAANAAPASGEVTLAAVRYQPYTTSASYGGGCINQCVESKGRCGTCGLGNWNCPSGGQCGPGNWTCGDAPAGQPTSCDDLVLPTGVDLARVSCDSSTAPTFLYVAPSGDDAQPGTREQPMRTIAAAQVAAQQKGAKALIIGAGVYAGRVTLVDGLSMYGGFSGDVDGDGVLDWIHRADFRSELTSDQVVTETNGVQRIITVVGTNIISPTVLDGLTITTAAADAGVSTYGVLVNASTALRLRRVTVEPGHAGIGARGTVGTVGGVGGAGEPDGRPFYIDPSNPALNSSTGLGGVNAVCPAANGGNGGSDMNQGCGLGVGLAGANGSGCGGQPDPSCSDSVRGGAGAAGATGQVGAQPSAVSPGTLDGTMWLAPAGNAGAIGSLGIGGSGGGGGCTSNVRGSGGGAGGCGGTGGGGGRPGGSSFGVFLVNSPGIVFEDVAVHAGNGGAGGEGGKGGEGGAGGAGGPARWGFPSAGLGGRGGTGGAGSGGGGGPGGVSYGLFCVNGLATFLGTNSVTAGTPGGAGPGGLAGVGTTRAPSGPAGLAAGSFGCN